MGTITLEGTMSETPKTIFLKDYKAPPFLAPQIDLHFELHDNETLLTATTSYERTSKSDYKTQELFLNGKNLELVSIARDGQTLSQDNYEIQEKGLLL